jgi:hypothetical protein
MRLGEWEGERERERDDQIGVTIEPLANLSMEKYRKHPHKCFTAI